MIASTCLLFTTVLLPEKHLMPSQVQLKLDCICYCLMSHLQLLFVFLRHAIQVPDRDVRDNGSVFLFCETMVCGPWTI